MNNQRYSPEFKDEAVRQIVVRGYSVAEISERFGVHLGCRQSTSGDVWHPRPLLAGTSPQRLANPPLIHFRLSSGNGPRRPGLSKGREWSEADAHARLIFWQPAPDPSRSITKRASSESLSIASRFPCSSQAADCPTLMKLSDGPTALHMTTSMPSLLATSGK